MILFSIVKRLLPTIHFDNRWTIALNGPIWINDSFLWSSNDLFQPPVFADCWTIVCNDPVTRFWNDRSQPSPLKIVERTLSTIPFYDRWTIVFNEPFLRLLSDGFQWSLLPVVERSCSKVPFCDHRTIFSNHPILPTVERSFVTIPSHDLFNDRSQPSHYTIVNRTFTEFPFYGR